LIYPADWDSADWYGPEGELRKFLVGIEVIVGTEDFENATFEADRFLTDDRDKLLSSRLIEASAVEYIRSSEKLTIPKSEDRYYYLTGDLVWVRTYDENGDLVDEGELRRFLSGIDYILYILGDDADFETFVFEMDNFLAIDDFTVILASRVLEATLADMTEEVLASDALIGFIKEPDGGYQWFRHAESEEEGITGVVRKGEYALTETTYQYSDLAGFLDAVRQMDDVKLNYNYINAYTIASSASEDSEKLAAALWDYSRVMRGSIATMLNEAIDSVPPTASKPVFTDDDFQNKDDVKKKLDEFAEFVDMISQPI
jgi:hypothetical protein